MSEQKYKDEIEKLTTMLAYTKDELNFHLSMQLSLQDKVTDPDATERVKELEAELKTSQLARNELRQEFEVMRDLYEKSKPLEIFFKLQVAYDTPEMQSLTVEQFDKKIKGFFNMISDQYPDDNEKRLEHGKRAHKLLCLTQHPDKNSNDPWATDKFKALHAAYQKFAE